MTTANKFCFILECFQILKCEQILYHILTERLTSGNITMLSHWVLKILQCLQRSLLSVFASWQTLCRGKKRIYPWGQAEYGCSLSGFSVCLGRAGVRLNVGDKCIPVCKTLKIKWHSGFSEEVHKEVVYGNDKRDMTNCLTIAG